MVRMREAGKKVLHGAALLFTGYWLIATSAPSEPARDCFTELGSSPRLLVTLADPAEGAVGGAGGESSEGQGDAGGSARDSGEGTTRPSCQGLDGIGPGSALLLELERGERPFTGPACYGYELARLEGVSEDVTVSRESPFLHPDALVVASGAYSAVDAPECRGSWSLELAPVTSPAKGTLVSPLEAGASERWRLVRSMDLEQAHFCPGFTTRGVLHCEDRFEVERIAEAP